MSINLSFAEMKDILKKRLKSSRYEHSLGVSDTAVFLAKRFGVDETKAKVAGLLHDCAREYANDELLAEAKKRGITVGAIEKARPLLLHAYVGAFRVRELYKVDDKTIEQAIWRHTVGGANMTDLDKIVWFADMIEPGRDYPEVARLRKLAQEAALDEMLLAGLSDSILFVVQQGNLVHPDTVIARNEILLRRC